ncbi:YheT family hydrolase [Desulfotalea psychrophila]|uniref:Serine aminopeptidase S33 domain-containing protein n=1 Tax=Desulfotalea psychrophila (strain LSv54 / DSM 12343) TaxID=177439 RepID=Q6AR42_DESPS|nr:alpha/beta fold hydrolase [Desulfotalea psychrophila]CAG35182.1 conserved hypothetical protein [Desulfotalea psychrophila LSv54]
MNRPYLPPLWLRNGHIQSIYASLSRPRYRLNYQRERIDTPDNDFLDLDWSLCGENRSRDLIILSHGLEGHTRRNYITGMAGCLNKAGIDSLSWNYRGCSGEPNRQLRMYHNGVIDDLDLVVRHGIGAGYKNIFLIGFSLGGNLTLLYLGKTGKGLAKEIRGAVAFSVPCDLAGAAEEISKPKNAIYMRRFLKDLHTKVKAKQDLFPTKINDHGYGRIKNFKEFDDCYTAPIHGFKNAEDYWQKCSCLPWLDKIKLPCMMVNSLDDPFLSKSCYPVEIARQTKQLHLIRPRYGGHVGFVALNREKEYWSEAITKSFIRSTLDQHHLPDQPE